MKRVEIFCMTSDDIADLPEADQADWEVGWYWWEREPGCLPDSDAFGPFKSCEEATNDYEEAEAEQRACTN